MASPSPTRVYRELFLASFGAHVGAAEPWVTDRLTALLEDLGARAGETLFSVGDPPLFHYFLREGQVQLVRPGFVPWTFERHSVFGMSDALLDRPRVRTAMALTDIQAMKIHSEAWIELLEDSFALARAALFGSVATVANLEQNLWARTGGRRAGAPSPGRPADLDFTERLAVLVETPLLRGAGVQILSDLADVSEVVAFGGGATLFERGRPPGRVFIILDGSVAAHRERPDVGWEGGAGDVVCGTAAFGEPIGAWEAVAQTPT
ncbi:MAG TPA: cyclic nucleotide-binding domain-containing protein, partial [Polyangiaceae bacterium]|nr:cyclic nucleotide-binding domain-containing protein [Polyangiaceae bacterium]